MRPFTQTLVRERVIHAVQLFSAVLVCAAACAEPAIDGARVSYIDAPPIGTWAFEAPDAGAGGAAGGIAPPQAGTGGGAVMTAGMGSAGSAAVVSQLRFNVTTLALGGTYAPKNIGAIWISDESGRHVRTLELWASIRRRYLAQWNAATGGDRTDVVSRATLRMHEPHEVVWDLTDKAGQRVAPGTYRLTVETTDRSGTGQFFSVPFTLDAPLELTPQDTPYYASMRLVVE